MRAFCSCFKLLQKLEIHGTISQIFLLMFPSDLTWQELPRVIFYDDFGQVDRREWLCIQEAAVISDRQDSLKLSALLISSFGFHGDFGQVDRWEWRCI